MELFSSLFEKAMLPVFKEEITVSLVMFVPGVQKNCGEACFRGVCCA